MLPPIGDGEDPATVAVEVGAATLVLSVSGGAWAATALSGDDDSYDLVGDRSLDGEVGFVQGGQLVDHPRRHLVPLAAAQRAATDFLRTGTIEPDGWEPQP